MRQFYQEKRKVYWGSGTLPSLIHSMTMTPRQQQVRAETSSVNMADNLDYAIVQTCATWGLIWHAWTSAVQMLLMIWLKTNMIF